MKKNIATRSLQLSRESVRLLAGRELTAVAGGRPSYEDMCDDPGQMDPDWPSGRRPTRP